MNKRPKQRWGCLQWGVVGMVIMLAWMWMSSQITNAAKIAPQMKGVSNCKQVIIALKQFAAENDSNYPDAPTSGFTPVSSNQIFRRLFQEGIVTDERIFGCYGSGFVPDTRIGTAPGFDQALEPGECHWMLLQGQTDGSPADVPVVIENALGTSVPPHWELSPKSAFERGRAWKGSTVIIGRNDGSVQLERLRADGTPKGHYSPPNTDGRSWFDLLTPEERRKLSYWDIEERRAP